MPDDQALQQFIELRARGLTFAAISQQLNIPKTTLVNWSKQTQHLVHNLRTMQWEEFLDRTIATREQRLQSLASQLQRLETELANRPLETIPTHRLHLMAEQLRKRLDHEATPGHFNASCQISNDAIQSWQP